MKKLSIIIIYTPFRNIQKHIVSVFEESVLNKSIFADISSIDMTEYIIFSKQIYNFVYNVIIKRFEKIWGVFLYVLNDKIVNKSFLPILNKLTACFFKKRIFLNILEKHNPDIIIVTSLFLARFFSFLKSKKVIKSKLVYFITDFYINNISVNENIDEYFIPIESMKPALMAKGVYEYKIKKIGIILERKFMLKADKVEACRKLSIRESIFNILLCVNNFNYKQIEDVIKTVSLLSCKAKLILYGELEKKTYEKLQLLGLNLRICFDIVNKKTDFLVLIDACDLLISNYTNLIYFEAVSKKIPIIIWGKVPRHSNKRFEILVKENLVMKIDESKELGEKISELLNNPGYKEDIIRKMSLVSNLKQLENLYANIRAN